MGCLFYFRDGGLLQLGQQQLGDLEVDDKTGAIHQSGDEGADTTAGSMRKRRSTMGITDATVALHSTMAMMVRVTTMPIWGPTPRLQARTQAASAMRPR